MIIGRCDLRGLLVLGALALGRASAEEPAKSEKGSMRGEITPELELSVQRGLSYLRQSQKTDGDFDGEYPVAVNALAGLAILSGGHNEAEGGAYSEMLRKGTTALLRRQRRSGYFDDSQSLMYGHGFATLYLAELYGSSSFRSKEIREALERAVRVIVGSQSREGGWDYDPSEKFCEVRRSSGQSDTSITVCQTMALRAARNLGLAISKDTIENARRYIANAQNPADGGFIYRNDLRGALPLGSLSGSAFPRSAAGVCILYSLGEYSSADLKKGFGYLAKEYRFPWSNQFPYYAHYYCAQAMFQAGGTYWREYFPWVRAELISKQEKDGSWKGERHENSGQATAMALIILQLPYRFLPIFER